MTRRNVTDRVAAFFVAAWRERPFQLSKLALTLQQQGLVPGDLDHVQGRAAIYAVATILPRFDRPQDNPGVGGIWACEDTVTPLRLEPTWRHVVNAAERQIDLAAQQKHKRS